MKKVSVNTAQGEVRAAGLFRRAILQSGAAHQVTPAGDALRIPGYLAVKSGVPATRDAIAGAAAGTYMYEFAWAAPGIGAVHALEVPFVFDTASPEAPLFGPLLGDDPPQDLARTMHAA